MNLEALIQYGALGVVTAVSLAQLFVLYNRLFKTLTTALQENAAAMSKSAAALEKLSEIIERCQLIHSNK